MTEDPGSPRERAPGSRWNRLAAGADRALVKRIMAELQAGDRHGSSTLNTRIGRRAMNEHWRRHLVDRLALGESLEQIDHDLRQVPGLTEEQRAALWLLAWGESQRRAATGTAGSVGEERAAGRSPRRSWRARSGDRRDEVIVSTLELARAETSMDVAVLGEIRDGREVVRHLAGDAQSFGLKLGASMPGEETYCQRLLEGRLSHVVADACTHELVKD